MNFNQWLTKFKITDPAEILKYTIWFNHQATERMKANLNKVVPDQVKINRNTVKSGILSFFKDKGITAGFSELCQLLGSNVYTDNIECVFENSGAKIPNYLITAAEQESGYHTTYCSQPELKIDYSKLSLDLTPLHFAKKGDFMIVLPKTNWEVHKGAMLARNCVSVQATDLITALNTNPKDFELRYRYLDAHILKDNTLVGILALEEIFHIRDSKSPRRSLFVGNCNTTDKEMEEFCLQWVNETLNLNLPAYSLNKFCTAKSIDGSYSSFNNLINEIQNLWCGYER